MIFKEKELPQECVDWYKSVEGAHGFVNLIEFAPLIWFAWQYASEKSGQALESNVLMHGRGGFGKSEATVALIQSLPGIEGSWAVQNINARTTPAAVFGDEDLKTWEETGQRTLNSAWTDKKLVVLEEMLDAPTSTTESLKGALSHRMAMFGSARLPILTDLIIALTNKSPSDIGGTDSIEALLSRFPFIYKVGWNNLDEQGWNKATNTILDSTYSGKWESGQKEFFCNVVWALKLSPRDTKNVISWARMIAGGKALSADHLASSLEMRGVGKPFSEQIRVARQRANVEVLQTSMDMLLSGMKDGIRPLIQQAEQASASKPTQLAGLYSQIKQAEERLKPQIDALIAAKYKEEMYGQKGKAVAVDISTQAGNILDEIDKAKQDIINRLGEAAIKGIRMSLDNK